MKELCEVSDKKNILISNSALKAAEDAEAVIVLTEWEEFKNLEWGDIYM